MADNIGYTPGSGATVAADEVGGVLYQRVKPVVGIDGVVVDVSDANPMPVRDESMFFLFKRLLSLLGSPMGFDKSLQRQRGTVVVESGTVTTVTTVTTVLTTNTVNVVTSLNNFDGYNARMMVLDQNRSAWAQCVRARIT
jgi:NADPH:quinone reductase-like Zn-dependent oxidoreductase